MQQLKRRCYGNQLTLGPFCRRQNWSSLLFALAFPIKMQHRFVNAQINSYTNASTSCEILVKIDAVTSEFKRAKIENLPRQYADIGCRSASVVCSWWRTSVDCWWSTSRQHVNCRPLDTLLTLSITQTSLSTVVTCSSSCRWATAILHSLHGLYTAKLMVECTHLGRTPVWSRIGLPLIRHALINHTAAFNQSHDYSFFCCQSLLTSAF